MTSSYMQRSRERAPRVGRLDEEVAKAILMRQTSHENAYKHIFALSLTLGSKDAVRLATAIRRSALSHESSFEELADDIESVGKAMSSRQTLLADCRCNPTKSLATGT